MNKNPILDTDSYKLSHWLQYPPGTERVVSYIESRGSNYMSDSVDSTLFLGIQGFIEEFLKRPVTAEHIDEARWYLSQHGIRDWNEKDWWIIVNEFDGYLPLKIRSVREGTRVPFGNVLVTVENTDDRFYWLPTYVETALLRAIWYPTSVATVSRDIKDLLIEFHEKTSDEDSFGVNFKLHDFGCRGASSHETAALGGAAHLVNFLGTDTVPALPWVRRVYGDDMVAGFSIPASEHSTMTTWGEDGEYDAIDNMVQRFGGPESLVACVMDSYDVWNVINNVLMSHPLRRRIETHGGTLVVRPDSGDPVSTVIGVIESLMNNFGWTANSRGYKVLPPYLRVIQGDGVDRRSIEDILIAMVDRGLSLDNLAFGMGGALLQSVDRDTFKFAMKCSAVRIDGRWFRVSKSPVGDPSKKSKEGYLDLKEDMTTVDVMNEMVSGNLWWRDSLMEACYLNGDTWKPDTFAEVRKRATE